MLEESGAITSNAATADTNNGHATHNQTDSHQDDEDEDNHTFMGLALAGRSNSILEDVEDGRRT